ncbi:hypothetical protein [Planktothrix mougeotii]|uniref:hypothetical protein n=1 Tax=Planktothrix mougeotii TaxID=54306 RepID=UPI001D158E25|nr:hypothetical protein [Planktothrix mougeotii]
MINPLRKKLHYLVDQISEEDLGKAWKSLQTLFYDTYMLKAIQEAKETLTPGDSLTYDEALELLHFEYSRPSGSHSEHHHPTYRPIPQMND